MKKQQDEFWITEENQSALTQELEESFARLEIICKRIGKNLELMNRKISLQEKIIMHSEQLMQRMRPLNEKESKEFLTRNQS